MTDVPPSAEEINWKKLYLIISGPQVQVDLNLLREIFPNNVELNSAVSLLEENALTENRDYAMGRASKPLFPRELKSIAGLV